MKNILSKRYVIKWTCALVLMVAGYTSNAQSNLKNFSGTWLLNEEKCDFGKLSAANASKIKTITISQSEEQISIQSGDSSARSSTVLRLNGRPSEQTVVTVINDIPNTSTNSISVKIINSQSLISTMKDQISLLSLSIKTYTISDDGQALTIAFNNTYGDNVLAGKLVYEKKKE
ncbi:hypothetical protein [Mucilaginibacter sp. SG564]|uniref:hypothetical protein n=1 Tax=Mucilaginibacter sp. SG564 TaxID=2587022 RepID=UPI001556C932|nr:hypothetical protein [Mucilaginibacter sp. SG564]NOW95041.1 hypothetical protein [Mucilaginibacter sp. SG564]